METATAEVALYDAATAEMLAGLTTADDIVASATVDMLKMNYDEDSIFPKGSWVLGQKKKENVIIEHGVAVKEAFFLATRCRFSYYHEADGTYHNTTMFKNGEQPPDKAEVAAKVAALKGELKFQIVVLGVAVVEDGLKEFISFFGGSAYKATSDFLKELTTLITPTKKLNLPLFNSKVLLLDGEKKKNGTLVYFIPIFKKGPMVTAENIPDLAQARDRAIEYVEHSNSMAASGSTGKGAATTVGSATYEPPVEAANPIRYAEPASTGDDVPFDFAVPASSETINVPANPGASDDFDIEKAMQDIINGGK